MNIGSLIINEKNNDYGINLKSCDNYDYKTSIMVSNIKIPEANSVNFNPSLNLNFLAPTNLKPTAIDIISDDLSGGNSITYNLDHTSDTISEIGLRIRLPSLSGLLGNYYYKNLAPILLIKEIIIDNNNLPFHYLHQNNIMMNYLKNKKNMECYFDFDEKTRKEKSKKEIDCYISLNIRDDMNFISTAKHFQTKRIKFIFNNISEIIQDEYNQNFVPTYIQMPYEKSIVIHKNFYDFDIKKQIIKGSFNILKTNYFNQTETTNGVNNNIMINNKSTNCKHIFVHVKDDNNNPIHESIVDEIELLYNGTSKAKGDSYLFNLIVPYEQYGICFPDPNMFMIPLCVMKNIISTVKNITFAGTNMHLIDHKSLRIKFKKSGPRNVHIFGETQEEYKYSEDSKYENDWISKKIIKTIPQDNIKNIEIKTVIDANNMTELINNVIDTTTLINDVNDPTVLINDINDITETIFI
jgi:hypothetical protein